MRVSVIIPNYNGAEILKRNLPKVFESISSTNLSSEIIISDDSSSDNSLEVISDFIKNNKNKHTDIRLVTSTKNYGFSSNVNRGVSEAKGEILILLNTDVTPSKDFLEPLLTHFDNEKVFAVGCMDESVEGGKIVLRGRGKGHWEKGFLRHSAADINGLTTLWVSGGSGAFRRSIWNSLGGLDKIYDPFYWEDIDLSYRALKSGYTTIFEKRSVVRHEHEKGVIKTKFKSKDIKQIVYRNQFIFAWKNPDTSILINGILWLPYHIINALISRDIALIIGFFMALGKFTEIAKSRSTSSKNWVISDKEVTAVA